MERDCKYCGCPHPLTSEYWYRLSGSPKCKKRSSDVKKQNYDPEKQRQVNARYRSLHKDELNENNRKWRESNADKHRENSRNWYYANRDRRIAKHTEYCRERERTDIEFKLRRRIGNRMYCALKGLGKPDSSTKSLGCTTAELKRYLEEQFQPGMSWDNYGSVWEVDHILPLANYQLTDRGTFRRLSHYTNLQPLFRGQNRQKSNKEN